MKKVLIVSITAIFLIVGCGSDTSGSSSNSYNDSFVDRCASGNTAGMQTITLGIIGNSMTTANDLPTVLYRAGQSADICFEIESYLENGATSLGSHRSKDKARQILFKDMDYVILQENSSGIGRAGTVYQMPYYLSILKTTDTKIIVPIVGSFVRYNDTHWKDKYIDPAHSLADDYNISLEPTVQTVANLIDNHGIQLSQSDNHHPNRLGTYLRAMNIISMITQKPTLGLHDGSLNISKTDKENIQKEVDSFALTYKYHDFIPRPTKELFDTVLNSGDTKEIDGISGCSTNTNCGEPQKTRYFELMTGANPQKLEISMYGQNTLLELSDYGFHSFLLQNTTTKKTMYVPWINTDKNMRDAIYRSTDKLQPNTKYNMIMSGGQSIQMETKVDFNITF